MKNAHTETSGSSGTSGTSGTSGSLFSILEYEKGDIKIQKQIGEQLNKFLLKIAGYALTTILGGLVVIVWQMRSELSEVKGRVFSPDKYLETLDSRLNKLEKENNELQTNNYQLEINKMRLELEIKKENRRVNLLLMQI